MRTSIATVSYVLNNKGRYLRPELRDRVLLAADALGYVKNAAASSLKGLPRGVVRLAGRQRQFLRLRCDGLAKQLLSRRLRARLLRRPNCHHNRSNSNHSSRQQHRRFHDRAQRLNGRIA